VLRIASLAKLDVLPRKKSRYSSLIVNVSPVLLYGLEACPINKSDLSSIDFVFNKYFMKLFRTSNIETVKAAQFYIGISLFIFYIGISLLGCVVLCNRIEKFEENLDFEWICLS